MANQNDKRLAAHILIRGVLLSVLLIFPLSFVLKHIETTENEAFRSFLWVFSTLYFPAAVLAIAYYKKLWAILRQWARERKNR